MMFRRRIVAVAAVAVGSMTLVAAPARAVDTLQLGIVVKPVTSWGVPYTFVHLGQTAKVYGSVRPAAVKSLRLQYSTNGGATWTSLVAKSTDANGNLNVDIKPPQTRDYSWALPSDSQTAFARSATVHITLYAALAAYPNCTELNKRYPHGVGKPNAADHTTGTPVRNFLPSAAAYALNDGGVNQADLDRDNDGIACEKA